jgi:hypothetical protein
MSDRNDPTRRAIDDDELSVDELEAVAGGVEDDNYKCTVINNNVAGCGGTKAE